VNLDINTPKGIPFGKLQFEAIEIVLPYMNGMSFVHTPVTGAASVDGFFYKDNVITALAEVKSRQCSLEHFMTVFKGEWLITAQKLVNLKLYCQCFGVVGYGILYLPKSGIVLKRKLVYNGSFVEEFRRETTKTQKSVNGGEIERLNAFVPMHRAMKYEKPGPDQTRVC